MWLVRTSGPDHPLIWEGKGQHSIGVFSLPKNEPIHIKDFRYGAPAAEGSYHKTGSKTETKVVLIKKAADVLREIKTVYHALTFEVFETRDEALTFIQTGLSDYSLLGVDRRASQDEIRKAYYTAAMVHHPDLGGSTDKFQQIQSAYERLSKAGK